MNQLKVSAKSPNEKIKMTLPTTPQTLGAEDMQVHPTKVEVKDLGLFYGKFQAIGNINMTIQENQGHCDYWPIRLWKVDCAALLQSHERPGAWCESGWRSADRR